MTDKQPPSQGLTQAETAALPASSLAITQEVIDKIPKDFHNITITSLLPLLTVIMAHVQQVKDLKGDDKKKLVLYCLNLMIKNMPFPERQVIQPIAEAIAPAAIEGIIRGSRFAAKHTEDLIVSQLKKKQDPAAHQLLSRITWPALPQRRKVPPPKKSTPTNMIKQKICMGRLVSPSISLGVKNRMVSACV